MLCLVNCMFKLVHQVCTSYARSFRCNCAWNQPQTSPYIRPWISCNCDWKKALSELANKLHTMLLIHNRYTFLPTSYIPCCGPTHTYKHCWKYVSLPLRSPSIPSSLCHKVNKGSITHMSTSTPVMSNIPQSHFTLEAPHIKQQLSDALPNLHNTINSTLFSSPVTFSSFCRHLLQ